MHELTQEQVDSLLDTLHRAKVDFAFVGGCILTDRPDLPLSPETSWTMDFSGVMAAIDAAVAMLGGDHGRTDPGSSRCSTCLPMEPIEGLARCEAAPRGSRSPESRS